MNELKNQITEIHSYLEKNKCYIDSSSSNYNGSNSSGGSNSSSSSGSVGEATAAATTTKTATTTVATAATAAAAATATVKPAQGIKCYMTPKKNFFNDKKKDKTLSYLV